MRCHQRPDRWPYRGAARSPALSRARRSATLAPSGIAVIYVCGYAQTFDGRTYVLPNGARIELPSDLLAQGVAVRALGRSLNAAKAARSLVLLDLVALPGTASLPGLDAVAPDAEFLAALSRDLAVHLGPIAATLVRRAAAHAPARDALCRALAKHLQQREQRSAFLRRNSIGDHPAAPDHTARPSSEPALSAEAIAAVQAVLAAEMGPIATLIVHKAAAAKQSESGFLDDLAAQTPIAGALRAKLQSAMRTRHDSA